ncbi:hypothetical protein F5H01DRAFT_401412 [Linnemannia elongata]|nr:hypothetical protein F5H01DRAFT_401412 [Linnemannia elongata]
MDNNPLTLFCLADGEGTSNAFSIKIASTDTVDDLKERIKTKKSPEFDDIAADKLTLWRVSIQVVSANKHKPILLNEIDSPTELDPTDDLSDVFEETPPKKTIHVILQRPPPEADGRIVRRRLTAALYDGREASMTLRKDDFKGFPLNDKRSFEAIRSNPQYAYFDRTGYISVLESFLESVLLFLRPRRFGKSLFLSTLAHFHGVEHKQSHKELFQGLDVDRDVRSEKVTPGQYLILTFDFSAVNRSPDVKTAEDSLNAMIHSAIGNFYRIYAQYLGEATSEQLIAKNIDPSGAVGSLSGCVNLVTETLGAVREMDDPLYGVKGPDDPRPWDRLSTSANSLLKGFWATVKSKLGPRSIAKCFITGVSPLSMANHTSGFNVATYVSWWEELSGLCGLTEEDVHAALNLLSVSKSEIEIQRHFDIMKANYNGYMFAPPSKVQQVFNTNTCLEYLQSLMRGVPINPSAVSNSEVSESALQILAASPVASSIISDSLESQIMPSNVVQSRSIPYQDLSQSFRLTGLASDIATSKPAWLSYMLHIGGLTFCGDSKQLQIPNLVAAERFGNATLDHLKLRLEDVDLAFRNIVSSGNVHQAFALYKRTMEIRDVGDNDFKKTEENHRDSFHYALLGNSHPSLRKIGLKTQITKTPQNFGRIDTLIQVPSKRRVLLLKWKAIQIDFLDIGAWRGRKEKAEHLRGMTDANDVLDLQFSRYDAWRPGQTIRGWITEGPIRDNNKSPRQQLAEYVASSEITKLKEDNEVTAYLVVVIGSRQVLFWEMDNGYFQKDPHLAA